LASSALFFGWSYHQVRKPDFRDVGKYVLTSRSPKFFSKIVYISTLSELAYHVPLTQIDIPPAVYK
jgi:hypothetical protein